MKETLRGGQRDLVRQVRDKPRAHCWDKRMAQWEREPIRRLEARDFIVARDTGTSLGPGIKPTASWETQETPDTCTSLTTSTLKPDR